MKPVTLRYEDFPSGEKQETVSTPEQLKLRMQSICDECSSRVGMPFGVDLVADNGDRLSVALGQGHAVIAHFDAEHVVITTAVGNMTAEGKTAFYFGDHTLMPNKFLIPVDKAWHIIGEWCEHGTLSSKIKWTTAIR